jgi:glycine cleavage system H protein
MYPGHLKYSKEHAWLKLEDDNKGRVGITHYYQEQLKKIVFVELPESDSIVIQNGAFGIVESSKATCDLYSPVSGTVVKVNSLLEIEPDLVNSDPYGRGWMIVVELSNPCELDSLLSIEEYLSLIEQ